MDTTLDIDFHFFISLSQRDIMRFVMWIMVICTTIREWNLHGMSEQLILAFMTVYILFKVDRCARATQ